MDTTILDRELTHVRDFVVLDLDRTLIDNDILVAIIIESLSRLGMNASEVAHLQAEEKAARGKSFDVIGALQLVAPDLSTNSIFEAVMSHPTSKNIVVSGTKELLATLKGSRVPHGILTYGTNPEWQTLKVDVLRSLCAITEEELPATVTGTKGKAFFIENKWYDASKQQFLVPEVQCNVRGGVWADAVHIVDDKQSNLEHSGVSRIYTYLVLPSSAESLQCQIKILKKRLLG